MYTINPQDSFLIINSVALNGGDAAILLAMVNSLKRRFGSDKKILVQAKKDEICKKYYPEIDFMPGLENKEKGRNIFEKIFLRFKSIRILFYSLLENIVGFKAPFLLTTTEESIINAFRTNKNIISCGGGFLNDYYPLHSRMLSFILAKLYKCNYYIYAQSVGPFWKTISKMQASWILNNASLVTVRDEKSYSLIKEQLKIIGNNIHLTADEAHLLPSMVPAENPLETVKKENPDKLIVGISVREWEFKDIPDRVIRKRTEHRYHRKILELCIHLVEKYDARIVFISTCQGRPEYFIDDSHFASHLIKLLPYNMRNKITVISDAYDPRELKEIMKSFDIFAGVRMHTLVLALSSGIPCIGLGYEFKTEELFNQLKLSHYAIDLKSDRLENLNDIADELIENRETVSGEVLKNIEIIRDKARNNVLLLKNTTG